MWMPDKQQTSCLGEEEAEDRGQGIGGIRGRRRKGCLGF